MRNDLAKRIFLALAALIFIALLYTTPWDNFLVENNIWFYDPAKVNGFLIGFVPVEEYTFFIVQTILAGLFFGLVYLKKDLDQELSSPQTMRSYWRIFAVIILGGIWFIMLVSFIGNFQPLRYMSLILLWAIPPIIIQLLYGLDILWIRKRELFFAISIATIYLAIIDTIAIFNGIWTISTGTSTGILLIGLLPLEEFIFFLVTNILIMFGLLLMVDPMSKSRFFNNLSEIKKILIGVTNYDESID